MSKEVARLPQSFLFIYEVGRSKRRCICLISKSAVIQDFLFYVSWTHIFAHIYATEEHTSRLTLSMRNYKLHTA